MTNPAPFRPKTHMVFCARLHLAGELGIEPSELEYGGVQEGMGYYLLLFHVDRPGDRLHGTTRSVRIEL